MFINLKLNIKPHQTPHAENSRIKSFITHQQHILNQRSLKYKSQSRRIHSLFENTRKNIRHQYIDPENISNVHLESDVRGKSIHSSNLNPSTNRDSFQTTRSFSLCSALLAQERNAVYFERLCPSLSRLSHFQTRLSLPCVGGLRTLRERKGTRLRSWDRTCFLSGCQGCHGDGGSVQWDLVEPRGRRETTTQRSNIFRPVTIRQVRRRCLAKLLKTQKNLSLCLDAKCEPVRDLGSQLGGTQCSALARDNAPRGGQRKLASSTDLRRVKRINLRTKPWNRFVRIQRENVEFHQVQWKRLRRGTGPPSRLGVVLNYRAAFSSAWRRTCISTSNMFGCPREAVRVKVKVRFA